MSQLNYHELMKQALAPNTLLVETITADSSIPQTGPSKYPFVGGKQYVYENPCTECKKQNPKQGHNCWKYS